MFETLLRIPSFLLVMAVALYITSFSCREMRRLFKAKMMKRWEVGLFSGWLIGGTIFYFFACLIVTIYPHVGFNMWRSLAFCFASALFVTGPIGTAAAYVPWHLFARRRQPKILGCGLHGSVRSRLVLLPGAVANNKEFVAVHCKSVLNISREKWKERLYVPTQIEPPPLTKTEWKVINCRVNSDPM